MKEKEMDDFLPAKELNRAQRKIAAAVQRGRGNDYIPTATDIDHNSASAFADVSEEILLRRLNAAISHMKEEDYFRSFGSVYDQAVSESAVGASQIICYGLGSFGHSMASRYQLAFLVLLKEKLEIPVEIFDPSFTLNEIKVMTKLGFSVLEKNEEGKRRVGVCTLFYMPHAPHQLVNNLIYSNWFPDSISNCLFICNSFSNLKHSFPKRTLRQNLRYIDISELITVEYGIINTFPYKDIFNDMAFHIFPLQKNKVHLPKDFWEKTVEPAYQQLEYVKATTNPPIPEA